MDSQIWTEKYRPSNFGEVVGQKEIINRIKSLVESKNIPHMLFAGPPGVGKTTTALIIAKQLHGKNWKNNFLELNASDNRGIDTIRNQVKDFAKTMAMEADAPKLILLDEGDALTKEGIDFLHPILKFKIQGPITTGTTIELFLFISVIILDIIYGLRAFF